MAQLVHPDVMRLIFTALDEQAPEFARANRHFLELAARHPEGLPASVKRDLLNRLLESLGPQILLQLAASSGERFLSPLLFVLLNSPDAAALVDKFAHHHKYFHSTNQCVRREDGECFIVVEHRAIDGGAISAAEDLFVCGVLRVLLEKIGYRNVACTWAQVGQAVLLKHLPELEMRAVPVAGCSRWRYTWTAFERLHHLPGLDEYFVSNAEPLLARNAPSTTEQVEKVLAEDLGRRWRIEEVARRLDLSARSLQRRLADECTSFVRVYAETRVGTAARLLRHSQLPLVDIGYLAGFADSAHFSREFKKAKGVTPMAYRRNKVSPQ